MGAIIYYKTVTGFESGTSTLYASANQAVSDAFSSIRVVQAYNLHAQVRGPGRGIMLKKKGVVRWLLSMPRGSWPPKSALGTRSPVGPA